jgi:general stress protein 26
MRTNINNPADVEHRLWNDIEAHQIGMLMAVGGAAHHAQPMTAFAERGRRQMWFFTRNDTDLVRQIGDGHEAMFMFQQRDLQACIDGHLTVQHDPVRMERYWNAVVAAWHPAGRNDPKLTLLCLDCNDAQVWLSEAGPVKFAWEIAKANATRHQPDLGGRAHLDFH